MAIHRIYRHEASKIDAAGRVSRRSGTPQQQRERDVFHGVRRTIQPRSWKRQSHRRRCNGSATRCRRLVQRGLLPVTAGLAMISVALT
jgi:hypothetical protein